MLNKKLQKHANVNVHAPIPQYFVPSGEEQKRILLWKAAKVLYIH